MAMLEPNDLTLELFRNLDVRVEEMPLTVAPSALVHLPGLVGELLGIAVERVTPKVYVGRVHIYEVTPWKVRDPELIVCGGCDLRMYYHLWKEWALQKFRHESPSDHALDVAIDDARRSAARFLPEEQVYLYLRLLGWKNEIRKRGL